MSQAFNLQPKKVLFIATRQIGDVLVSTPLISKARELWPDAQFHFLDRKSTRLNSSHVKRSRMPSSA